jgi:hypothetical protein
MMLEKRMMRVMMRMKYENTDNKRDDDDDVCDEVGYEG